MHEALFQNTNKGKGVDNNKEMTIKANKVMTIIIMSPTSQVS